MSLFTPSLTQATDNNGDPISGAKWWFYLSGTVTGANVYSDGDQTVSVGASITADASGRFDPVYLSDSVTYRAILKTAAGATILDVDPIVPEDVVAPAAAAIAAAAAAEVSAASAEADALTAQLALAATATQDPYPNAYASTLPKGVTSISIGTAGTGGTPGTYALGVSGGPTGFAGTYTISGGGVTAITITNSGLATGTSAPTLSFPSGSVSGAAATATVSSLIADQERYWTASDDSLSMALWINNGGTVTAVANPDATQIELPNVARIAGIEADIAAFDPIVGMADQTRGFTGDIGASWDGGTLYTLAGAEKSFTIDQAAGAGDVTEVVFNVWSVGSGDINLLVLNPNTTFPTLDIVSSHAITATGTGQQTFTSADFGTITLAGGQYLGFSIPTGGPTIMGYKDTTPETYYLNTAETTGSHTFSVFGGSPGDCMMVRFVQNVPTVLINTGNFADPVASLPYLAAPTTVREWDIIPIGGQSNAAGESGQVNNTLIETGIAKQYYSSALSDITEDPVGNAIGSSMWPAFANAYWAATGRGVIFVPAAVGGSGLIAAGALGLGNWSPSGSYRAALVTATQAAMTAATSAGLAWRLGPIMWMQGELEAIRIDGIISPSTDLNGNAITAANHTAGLAALFAYFRAQFAKPYLPIIVSNIGTIDTGDSTGYETIRGAISDAVDADPYTRMGYVGAINWSTRGEMVTDYHGTTTVYNEAGKSMAQAAAACAR